MSRSALVKQVLEIPLRLPFWKVLPLTLLTVQFGRNLVAGHVQAIACRNSGMAQWLTCLAHDPKVRGSKPRSASFVLAQRPSTTHFAN